MISIALSPRRAALRPCSCRLGVLCWHTTALASLKWLACLPAIRNILVFRRGTLCHCAITGQKKKPFLFARLGNLSNLFTKYCHGVNLQQTPVVKVLSFFLRVSISKIETLFVFVVVHFSIIYKLFFSRILFPIMPLLLNHRPFKGRCELLMCN